MNKQSASLYLLIFGLILLCLAGVVARPASIQAQGDPLPTPTPLGTPAPTAVPLSATGGTIILQAYNAPANGWTMVQWQDANGAWHDVAGWQSQLTDGYVGWWVSPEHFGAGPFRWLLLETAEGELLVESDAFYLPGYAKGVVLVEISVE